ncbi:MAG: endonuclease [Nanoarchaeota archaeon]|nr:endonuclease [Nanoarchaeota archaeon]MBU2520461.1 endonuclease [Nanoarchaeota archaeon]
MYSDLLFVIVILLLIFVIYLYRNVYKENTKLRLLVEDLRSSKQSLSTKYGKMTEQFIPFLEVYPYNEQNFRFLGTPIDGVQFEDDKVIFIEFKTGDSNLTVKQNKIKDLVNKGKVEFKTIRINEKTSKE